MAADRVIDVALDLLETRLPEKQRNSKLAKTVQGLLTELKESRSTRAMGDVPTNAGTSTHRRSQNSHIIPISPDPGAYGAHGNYSGGNTYSGNTYRGSSTAQYSGNAAGSHFLGSHFAGHGAAPSGGGSYEGPRRGSGNQQRSIHTPLDNMVSDIISLPSPLSGPATGRSMLSVYPV